MPNENENAYRDLDRETLRAELLAYQKSQDPAELVPLPPGVVRGTLKPEQEEKLFDNWTAHLADQPASTYTPAERAAVNFKIIRVLKGL
jgi:hypothetical protein